MVSYLQRCKSGNTQRQDSHVTTAITSWMSLMVQNLLISLTVEQNIEEYGYCYGNIGVKEEFQTKNEPSDSMKSFHRA